MLNAHDYGVPQTRVRIYIVGFRDADCFCRFAPPQPLRHKPLLSSVLDGIGAYTHSDGDARKARWSLSCNAKGFNNYFLFNDLRGGETTIHSWDISTTTDKEKAICMLHLRNRRKKDYGPLDGNPLSLEHFRHLDPSITQHDIDGLVEKGILKEVDYSFELTGQTNGELTEAEAALLGEGDCGFFCVDELKNLRHLKLKKINVAATLAQMESNGIVKCVERRYDFKNGKISTGLNGINRIFLPSSDIYPTLVASDTNDYVTTVSIEADTIEEYRRKFLAEVYATGAYRQITKSEACRIQGFPADFRLPASRARWMHLIGNSVAVPVVTKLAWAVARTGVFGNAMAGIEAAAMANLGESQCQAGGTAHQLTIGF